MYARRVVPPACLVAEVCSSLLLVAAELGVKILMGPSHDLVKALPQV